MCAALQSGAFLKDLSGFAEDGSPRPHQLGHFFLALDIEHFVPLDEFKGTAGEILRALRAAEVSPDAERIYTAGEKAFLAEQRIRREGVPINPNLRRNLRVMAEELGLKGYPF